MKRNFKFLQGILLLAVATIFVFSACNKETTIVCDGSTPTYDADIAMLINGNCMGSTCHSAGSSHGDFTSYANLGTVIANVELEKEGLINQTMPLGSGFLSQSELTMFRCWVDNGYPEN